MTIKKAATLLEKRFKGDLFLTKESVQSFIKEEINPVDFSIQDVSQEFKSRVFKVIIQFKRSKIQRVFEIFIKP